MKGTPMKAKFREYFMGVARLTGNLSVANRLKVGAVLVKKGTDGHYNILAFGYNGTPPGWDNACEDENKVTKPEVRHAEENLLYKMSKSHESSDGSVVFITHLPCVQCAKMLHGIGVSAVYYKDMYRDNAALAYFKEAGVICMQVDTNEVIAVLDIETRGIVMPPKEDIRLEDRWSPYPIDNDDEDHIIVDYNLYQRLARIMSDHFDIDRTIIKTRTKMIQDLGLDSLDLVELIMAAEDEFEICINDNELFDIDPINVADTSKYTVGYMVNYIQSKMNENQPLSRV